MKETIGEYIHKVRLDKGMTLTKLAAALDIDQSTLSKIENNKRQITFEALDKFSKVFELDFDDLKKEYYSERIAELIYMEDNSNDLLLLAEEKTKYLRSKNVKQGNLNLDQL